MKTQQKKKHILAEESIETKGSKPSVQSGMTDIGKDAMKSFWEQFLKGSAESASQQVLTENIFSSESQGESHGADLQEGQEISLKKQEQKAEHAAQHNREYFKQDVDRDPTIIKKQEQQMLEQQIQQILIELKQLMQASSEMQVTFKEVETQDVPVEAGTYHVHFFEWVLSVVRAARQKVEDSGSWLAMFSSKKKQQGYWQQFKKHGTSFGLSSERNVATQVG